MNEIPKEKLREVFQSYPQIKLVYLFGSQARGETGPLSDYDFAVYFDEKDPKKMFNIKLELMGQLSTILRTDGILKAGFILLEYMLLHPLLSTLEF
jgi:predicted nucleotidyltransferase